MEANSVDSSKGKHFLVRDPEICINVPEQIYRPGNTKFLVMLDKCVTVS